MSYEWNHYCVSMFKVIVTPVFANYSLMVILIEKDLEKNELRYRPRN